MSIGIAYDSIIVDVDMASEYTSNVDLLIGPGGLLGTPGPARVWHFGLGRAEGTAQPARARPSFFF